MADIELMATKDFSYSTRRLKAGDSFTVPERMARVLVGIGKAEVPRKPGRIAAPVQRVLEAAKSAAPEKEAPSPVAAMTTKAAPKKAARRVRKSAAKKG